MKFHYYPDTDSLHIELSGRAGVDSRVVAPGIVLDFDATAHLVGIDIDHVIQTVGPGLKARERRLTQRADKRV